MYSTFFDNKASIMTGLSFALIIGIFHWSVQVVGMMGKNAKTRTPGFFIIETLALTGQFGILISFVY